MEKTKRLKVKYHGRDVGTMALWQGDWLRLSTVQRRFLYADFLQKNVE